jgi:hypothetical protein
MDTNWHSRIDGVPIQGPKNDTESADPKYWALREIQPIIGLPSDIRNSKIISSQLRNELEDRPISIGEIAYLPGRNSIAVLDYNNPRVHIFVGAAMRHRAAINTEDRIPIEISCTSDNVVLRFSNGDMGIFSMSALYLQDCLLLPEAAHGLEEIASRDLRMQTFSVDIPSLNGFQALSLSGDYHKILFWANDPLSFWMGELRDSTLHLRTLHLINSARMMDSVEITASCWASINSRVYLADGKSGRILEFSHSEGDPRLTVVAGDGVLAHDADQKFGLPHKSRLPKIDRLFEFRISDVEADLLSGMIVPAPESEHWLNLPNSTKPGLLRRKSKLLLRLIQESPFLAASVMQSGQLISVSFPRQGNSLLASLPDSSRSVLPIFPFNKRYRLEGWEFPLGEHRCTSAPGPSLIYFRIGHPTIQHVKTGFEEYAYKMSLNERDRGIVSPAIKAADIPKS